MRDVVQDLETMEELGALLGEEDPGEDVLVEPVLNPEVSLEVVVKKVRELGLKILR